ncbi:MAG: alpha-1,4-glucan--maltose-1-phosphate maltosyltransferase [Actinomycetota bacterium]
MIGRIPVLDVSPVVDAGRWPARAVVGEAIPVHATVFGEGHDIVRATVVLSDPYGAVRTKTTMTSLGSGLDRWGADIIADTEGEWTFRVEGWRDSYATWEHDAKIKVEAEVDVELMLTEGALLLDRAARQKERPTRDRAILRDAVTALRDRARPAQARFAAAVSPEVRDTLANDPLRDLISPTAEFPLRVQRERALVGAWYEFFPRSEGATRDPEGRWTSGTLRTAANRLPAIAAMGFDVAYVTPVHPIGATHRKGRNNTLTAEPDDPGSPYAIGSVAGGHDAIEPSLGTFRDWDYFVATAHHHGLEVALDLALQCSPDHPWVIEHPEWFTTRADGSIAYAENPPKKYQDIYPLNFDNDPDGIYAEVLRVVQLWIAHGVTLFRVDNPHTKPVQFWEWLIEEIRRDHPEVIFLSEAFTRPAMMHTLAKVGFHQSYTYFTWRTSKAELTDYLTELSGPAADYMRPNFWPTTHDILTPDMQDGGRSAFRMRAALAATMSPTYGIYSGYELVENRPRPGAQEQIDNEKYEFKPRDWAAAEAAGTSLGPWLTRLNEIRRAHPALQRLRPITFHHTADDHVLCFSKHLSAAQSPTGEANTIVVVVNLDSHHTRETLISLDLPALGAEWHDHLIAEDLVTGATWRWGPQNYIRLDPHHEPVHIVHVRRA